MCVRARVCFVGCTSVRVFLFSFVCYCVLVCMNRVFVCSGGRLRVCSSMRSCLYCLIYVCFCGLLLGYVCPYMSYLFSMFVERYLRTHTYAQTMFEHCMNWHDDIACITYIARFS